MTEALTAALAGSGQVSVGSRTSSMRYRGARMSLPEIGRELGVTHLVEGSIARSGSRVRVTAQLIDALSDRHVWARVYDRRDGDDLLSVQEELAAAITRDVAAMLSSAAR
jgi:TolB-like protein